MGYNKFFKEGVDFNFDDRVVSYNAEHQENVDTSLEMNPSIQELSYLGHSGDTYKYTTISILKRKPNDEKTDDSPLIRALKQQKDWTINNSDLIQIVTQCKKILKKVVDRYTFDTGIIIPSSSNLNNTILNKTTQIFKFENKITDSFFNLPADEVQYDIDFADITNDEDRHLLIRYFNVMIRKGNVFSFSEIKKKSLRNYVEKVYESYNDTPLIYEHLINDKDILVIDDTITSGMSISQFCTAIIETFDPKSITVLTLFSPLSLEVEESYRLDDFIIKE